MLNTTVPLTLDPKTIWLSSAERAGFIALNRELPMSISVSMFAVAGLYFFVRYLSVLYIAKFCAVDGKKELLTAQTKFASAFLRAFASVVFSAASIHLMRTNSWDAYLRPENYAGQFFCWDSTFSYFLVVEIAYYLTDILNIMRRRPIEDIPTITDPSIYRNVTQAAIILCYLFYPINATLGMVHMMHFASLHYIVDFFVDMSTFISTEGAAAYYPFITGLMSLSLFANLARLVSNVLATGLAFQWLHEFKVWEIKKFSYQPDAKTNKLLSIHTTRIMTVPIACTCMLLAARFDYQIFRWKWIGTGLIKDKLKEELLKLGFFKVDKKGRVKSAASAKKGGNVNAKKAKKNK